MPLLRLPQPVLPPLLPPLLQQSLFSCITALSWAVVLQFHWESKLLTPSWFMLPHWVAGQLLYQELAVPHIGWPLAVLAKGPGVGFSGGAPIMAWGPELKGFQRLIGRGVFTHGRYSCQGSVRCVAWNGVGLACGALACGRLGLPRRC